MLVECKSEVELTRLEINKTESGQMNNSCAWFERHYKEARATNIMIIPTNQVGHAAGFVSEVKIMREKELRQFRNRVKGFFMEFKNMNLQQLSEKTIQQFIDTHQLSESSLLAEYSVKTKQM